MKNLNYLHFQRYSKLPLLLLLLSFLLVQCKEKATTAINVGPYTFKMTKSDKKKYYDQNGTVVYEVKYKPETFKLRTPSSKLLWKVKLYGNKVKISDNEENLNPYEIKLLESNTAKLVKNETTIARTSYEKGVQVLYFSDNSEKPLQFSSDFEAHKLIWAISEIPKDQKEILASELKEKGY